MNANTASSALLQRICMTVVAMGLAGLLAACGGNDPPAAAPPPAAAITAQPTDQSAVVGTAATFSVTAANATGYQWQRSGDGGATFADVAGAVSTSHTTAATTLANSGAQYRVVVAGSGATVTSSAAALTVIAQAMAPGISVQPANQTIVAGQSASFSVTAAGTALTYQWQHSMDGGTTFTDEAGATAATLTLTAVAQLHNGHFLRVVVSNSVGSVISNAALLTVNAATAAAAITQQPTSQSVTAPGAATFSAAASGTPPPTLQWQIDSGAGWGNIIGATSPSYTTPATVVGDSGKQYRVMATNATGNVTSNAATLTVNAAATAPSFTTQPVSVTIVAGQSTQFTVAVGGTPTPGLQWQLSTDGGLNFSNITGATGPVFSVLNAAQSNNGRQFRAVASNGAGVVNSNAAVLTVNAPPAGGSIVFTRGFGIQSSPNDILLIREDGSGEISLATTADDEQFLGIAPGGRIVYRRSAGEQRHLYSVNADGTGTVLLVSSVSATDFPIFNGITPSGWVIYRRDTATTGRDLYAVKADGTGTGPVTLSATAGNDDFAFITPSGKIVYQVDLPSGHSDLYSVNPDGSGQVALATSTNHREGWTGIVNGGQVVFSSCLVNFSICTYSTISENGGTATLLATDTFEGQYRADGVTKTGRLIFSGSSVPNFDPAYQRDLYIDGTSTPLANSPDTESYMGSTADGRVLYHRLAPITFGRFRTDLYIVNADGTNTVLLASDAAFLAVAPDGRVIYNTIDSNGLYRVHAVNTDGTGAITLGNSANTFQDFFQGMTANGRVIFSQENGSVSSLSLFAVNTDGTGQARLGVRSYFVANTPSGKVLLRNNDNGNTNLSIVNPDGTGPIPLANTGNNEFFNTALP